MISTELTEARAAALVRSARTRKALATAPEVAYQLRWDATPLDGRTERGWLPEQRTPLLTALTDAADELYVVLMHWVDYWSAQIRQPAPAGWAWVGRDGSRLGFRTQTTPEGASSLVYASATWLIVHQAEIEQSSFAVIYEDIVTALVWDLRSAAGLIEARTRVAQTSSRPCPICGQLEVRAEYFGEPLEAAVTRGERILEEVEGIHVRCAHCGWVADHRADGRRVSAVTIARWLS